jgi:hypothetical protein
MRSRPVRKTIFPLVLLLAAACGSVKLPTEPSEEPGGGTALPFSRIQAEIFTPNCAKAGCHDAASGSAGLVLAAGQSYDEIVDVPSTGQSTLDRIEPGDPGRSYLIKKLRGDPDITGARMPLDRPGGLPQEQIDGIIAWVQAGAPHD